MWHDTEVCCNKSVSIYLEYFTKCISLVCYHFMILLIKMMNNKKFKIKFANTYASKFPKLLDIQKESYEFKIIKGLDKTKAFGGGSLWLHIEED